MWRPLSSSRPYVVKFWPGNKVRPWTAASDGWAHGAGGGSDVWAHGASGGGTLCFILPNSKDQRSCQGPVGTISPNYPVSPWLARPNHTLYISKGAKSWRTFFVYNVVLVWFWPFWKQQWLPQAAQLWVCGHGGWRNGRHTGELGKSRILSVHTANIHTPARGRLCWLREPGELESQRATFMTWTLAHSYRVTSAAKGGTVKSDAG